MELDGASHDGHSGYDLERQAWLESQKLAVLRISNDDVLHDPEAVVIGIARAAGIDVTEWMKRESLVAMRREKPKR